jgi:hypothetical protein
MVAWDMASDQAATSFYIGEMLSTCALTPDERTVVAGGVSGRILFLRLMEEEGLLSPRE